MTNRQTRFVNRIIVVTLFALVAALGARVVWESRELTKVLEPSGMRDLLLLAGPIASLALLQYTLALRSHGLRSLSTEALALVPPLSMFFLVTLPFYFRTVTVQELEDCAFWQVMGCSGEISRPNYWIMAGIIIALVLSVTALVRRERIRPTSAFSEI